MEERQAVARLKRGDISGLETLVQTYQVHAVRAAYLIVQDRALAEDIVQTAFVRAYERIAQFDANRPFGPWFLKSVINDSLKAITQQQRSVSLDWEAEREDTIWADRLIDPTPGPLEMAENVDMQRMIQDALSQLTPAQRAAIVSHYFLDFSEAEMTTKLNRPRGTVKWLLHAARERLRDILSPFLSDSGPQDSQASEND